MSGSGAHSRIFAKRRLALCVVQHPFTVAARDPFNSMVLCSFMHADRTLDLRSATNQLAVMTVGSSMLFGKVRGVSRPRSAEESGFAA